MNRKATTTDFFISLAVLCLLVTGTLAVVTELDVWNTPLLLHRDKVPPTVFTDIRTNDDIVWKGDAAKSTGFASEAENIRFYLPKGWSEVEFKTLSYTNRLEDIRFAFKKDNSGCVIAYAPAFSEEEWQSITQVSFGNRVFSKDWQFDSNWYVFKDSASTESGVSFSDYKRQPLKEDFRFSQLDRRGQVGFFLFTDNRTPVPEECSIDMNGLLTSVTRYYTPITLNEFSDGLLWVRNEWHDIQRGAKDTDTGALYLLFTPHGENKNYEVLQLDAWADVFLVLENKLYSINNQQNAEGSIRSAIMFADPFTGETGTIDGTILVNRYLLSLYPLNGEIYYLASTKDSVYCLDSLRGCYTDLYKVHPLSGVPQLLANDVLGRTILGYNKSENTLYLQDGYGDAGCFSSRFSRYVIGGGEEFIGEFGGCFDEEGYNDTQHAIDEIYKRAGYSTDWIKAVRMSGGKLLLPVSVSEYVREQSYAVFLFDK